MHLYAVCIPNPPVWSSSSQTVTTAPTRVTEYDHGHRIWCNTGTHVLLSFVSGFGHSRSMFCLVVGACGLEFAWAVCSSVHVDCVVLCSMRFVFGHVLFCCLVLLHAVCVFIGCVLSCCDVLCEHAAYEHSHWFSSHPFMAGDLFCWPCARVFVWLLSCVAMCSHVLTPPILLPDYWFLCPTCVFLITFLICSLFILLVFAVLCQFIVEYSSGCVLSLPCLAMPACFSPTG